MSFFEINMYLFNLASLRLIQLSANDPYHFYFGIKEVNCALDTIQDGKEKILG